MVWSYVLCLLSLMLMETEDKREKGLGSSEHVKRKRFKKKKKNEKKIRESGNTKDKVKGI